jgi:hypothetical protein
MFNYKLNSNPLKLVLPEIQLNASYLNKSVLLMEKDMEKIIDGALNESVSQEG